MFQVTEFHANSLNKFIRAYLSKYFNALWNTVYVLIKKVYPAYTYSKPSSSANFGIENLLHSLKFALFELLLLQMKNSHYDFVGWSQKNSHHIEGRTMQGLTLIARKIWNKQNKKYTQLMFRSCSVLKFQGGKVYEL